MAVIATPTIDILGQTWEPWYTPVVTPRVPNYVAQTATKISALYHIVLPSGDNPGRLQNVHVYLTVDKKKSWVLKSSMSGALLEHEVLHYCLAYLVAQEADYILENLRGSALAYEANRTLLVAEKRAQQLDYQYDYETNNGRPGPRGSDQGQSQWARKITDWLMAGKISFPFPIDSDYRYPTLATSTAQSPKFKPADLF